MVSASEAFHILVVFKHWSSHTCLGAVALALPNLLTHSKVDRLSDDSGEPQSLRTTAINKGVKELRTPPPPPLLPMLDSG